MKNYLKSNKLFRSLPEIKQKAQKKIFYKKWNWLETGSEYGNTLQANLDSFKNYKLIPRFQLIKKKKIKFLNKFLKIPLITILMGHLTQFHTNGEAEVALGAKEYGTFITISSLSRINLKEIKNYSKISLLIYQIYFYNSRKWVEEEIERAIEVGCKAIVVTIDSAAPSFKYKTLYDKYDARKFGRRTNFNNLIKKPYYPTWKDLVWLKKKLGKVPLIIKGLMHADDASKAFGIGASSVWISNHGGRAFESCYSSLEALKTIRKKLGKNKHLIFDGGIRTGSDIIKAIHAGANIVAVGRPIIYGLICKGYKGVFETLMLFEKEYETSRLLSGH